MAMPGVERDREQAARPPFEALLAPVGKLDLGRAGPLEYIDHVLIEMTVRRGRPARWYVEHEHIGEIAAALEMNRRRLDAVARPHRGLDRKQVDRVVLEHSQPFRLDPVEISIDAVARLLFAHGFLPFWMPSQPANRHENNNDLITTGTTPGGEINSPTSTKSSSASCTPSIETRSPERPSSSVRMRPMVLPISPSIISSRGWPRRPPGATAAMMAAPAAAMRGESGSPCQENAIATRASGARAGRARPAWIAAVRPAPSIAPPRSRPIQTTGTLCTGRMPCRGRWMVLPLTWTVNCDAPITVARMRWPGSISLSAVRCLSSARSSSASSLAISP